MSGLQVRYVRLEAVVAVPGSLEQSPIDLMGLSVLRLLRGYLHALSLVAPQEPHRRDSL